MDRAESLESLEIPDIDGRQLRDAVNVHARSQTGIVDLHALDVVRDEKPPPTIMHVAAVREKLKIPFDHARDTIRLGADRRSCSSATGYWYRGAMRRRPASVVIPIQTLAREGLIGPTGKPLSPSRQASATMNSGMPWRA
jgi:hypothetical protein